MSTVDLDSLRFIGHDLHRPECVLCNSAGRLFASDWRGGVAVLEPDGEQWLLLARGAGFELRPNGICLLPDGSVLLAHLGDCDGGVFRLDENGNLEPWLVEVEGQALPPTNYVHYDSQGRLWTSVSTRVQPRALGYRADRADGFIVLQDARGTRVVADGLGYTNECVLHPDGRRLFVNETFARRLVAFDVGEDGALSNRTLVAEFGEGTFPDGLTFDAEGAVWVTSVVSNRLIRVAPGGAWQVLLEDVDSDHLAQVERAYREGRMGREHLDRVHSRRLANISSLAFGGADLLTLYLGCLLGQQIATGRAPVAGHPPAHWRFAGPRRVRA